MKSIRSVIYILLFIAALLVAKYLFFPSVTDEKGGPPGKTQPAGAKPAMPPALVSVYIAEPQELDNNLFATGTILANETVELKPEISGKVTGIYIREGESVNKGTLLVKLNDADLQAQLKKLNAEVKLSEEKLNRYKSLLNIQGVSREEFDMATNQLLSLKADVEVLRVQINRCNITAPFTGVIGLRNISEGSFITPQQAVTTIQQLNPVKIDFSIPERYAGLIKKGSIIHFGTEGSAAKHQGQVYAFEPGIDAGSRSLKIRAKANNPGNLLLPGAFAKIELVLDKNENAIVVPTQSIVPILKGQQVFICRMGKAEAVPVETGLRTDTGVQIISGVNAGDSVIVTGVMGLRPGASIKIIK